MVALVTGGARGLGAAVCRQLAARGEVVAVADIDAAGAEAVARACGDAAFAVAVDLASADGPAWMVEETVRRAGRLDVLVNCAAVAPAEAFLDMTAAAWEQALLVNVRAIALAMAAAGRVMAAQGGGPDRQRHLGRRAHGAAQLRGLCREQGRGRFADPLGGGRARHAWHPGQQHLARHDGHAPAAGDRGDLLRARRAAPTSRRTRPSAPREFRSAGAAIPRRWRMVVWLALDAPDYMTAARLNVSGGLDKD